MTHAYSELYIDDAMMTMGHMMRYVDLDCHLDLETFFSWFIRSGVAYQFETGNPKYIAGKSGAELASEVVFKTKGKYLDVPYQFYEEAGEAYWTGWSMCYYQWYRNVSFEKILKSGLTISEIKRRYILHEADISKFVQVADEIIENNKREKSLLAYYRKLAGLTQKQLAEQSGVPLRMIQLYEQKQNDLHKASVDYVLRLTNTLGCSVESILEIQ